jgi:flavin-dependent dehydrogenase
MLKEGMLLSSAQFKDDLWQLNFQHQNESTSAQLLIGADGRQSTVAKILGWDGGHDYSRLALHTYIPHQLKLERRGEMHLLGEGAYFGLDPVKDNELNVTLALPAEQLRQFQNPNQCMSHFWNNHADLAQRFGVWKETYKLYSLAPINHRSVKICNSQAALVGDAAGLVDPLTGEGIYNALMSAFLLAEAVRQFPNDWNIHYHRQYKKLMSPKKKLNIMLQAVIKRRWVMAIIESFLRARNDRTNHFIGLIGNVWTPLQAFKKMF